MTKKEMILDYVAKNREPNQAVCPIIIQNWRGKCEGKEYRKCWRSDTGEMLVDAGFADSMLDSDRYRRYVCDRATSSYGYEFVYVNYCEEYKLVEFSIVKMAGNRHKEGEIGIWHFSDDRFYSREKRVFLFRGDLTPYGVAGEPIFQIENGKYYNKGFVNWFKNMTCVKVVPVAGKQFQKFAGISSFRVSRYSDTLDYPWNWCEWYKKSAPRPESKTQKSVNSIINAPLTSLEELAKRYPLICREVQRKTYNGSYYTDMEITAKDYFHFEIINDDYCVIRYLTRVYRGRYGGDAHINQKFDENIRIYIDSTGKATVTRYSDVSKTYQIISTPVNSVTGYYDKPNFGNLDEIKNWKRLSWIEDMVSKLSEKNKAACIVTILRHPIIEQVYKAGYHNLAEVLMDSNQVANNLNVLFGVKEKKKGSITKNLGVNARILKWMDNNIIINNDQRSYYNHYNYEIRHLIPVIKEIFGVDDISSWSQESIDTFFSPVLQVIRKNNRNWKYSLIPNGPRYYWGRRGDEYEVTEEDRRHVRHILRMGHKDPQILESYLDIIQTYHNLDDNNKPEINVVYGINNLREMNLFHNAIVELYNQQQAERQAMYNMREAERIKLEQKKFEKLQEDRREKFNYSNDEDPFFIKVPEVLSEITTEGQSLHHCVGGYLSRHATGGTNIIFLRKKELPTVPFYTIEVRDGNVVQIHGNCNCWLGKCPDAVRFVIKWLKEKGIRCEKRILLETASGYGSSGTLLNAADFGL